MPTEDIPLLARRAWYAYRTATEENRRAEEESLGFWVGGEHQWRAAEIANRRGNNRPWTTINRCKPAVDQVENEARNNPPGPEAHPVGNGADKDGADILEGLIREYEYRSHASTAYITALRYAAAGGSGCFELATDYRSGRTMEQCLVVKEIEDPAMVFCDPNARMRHRQDQMYGGKIRKLSREQIQEQYPDANLKIFNRGLIDRAAGWMQDAVGFRSMDRTTLAEWINLAADQYYVCEFWRVKIEKAKLYLYSDNIIRYEYEPIPKGVTVKTEPDGSEIMRTVPRRKITKHVVTALDELVEPVEWMGDLIPLFWVMGPEIYIKGKLHRLSLISSAIGSQRSLNYTATSMNEIVGLMTKSPFVGWEGQFDVQNAQGFNPWESQNTQVWAYMEVKPVWAINPANSDATLLPAPQRNTWEAPIARLFEALTFWGEQIKAATSIFFDPTVQSAADAQSGEAIKALQSQTNIGTLNWQDSLHSAVALSYGQAAQILPKILDGPRATTIVRPDSKHEILEINQEFSQGGIDPKTGQKGKKNNITLGEYSLRVTAGPSFETRNDKAIEKMMEFIKVAPQILGAPGVAGQFLRMIGEGNPEVEQMADALSPGADNQDPAQLNIQLQQAQQEKQAMTVVIQKLQMALAAKLPEIDAKKLIAAMDNLTKIEVAKITASKDADSADADREAAALEHLTGLAHEAAQQAVDHEHDHEMADKQAQQAQIQQATQQQHEQEMQENQPEPAGASQ